MDNKDALCAELAKYVNEKYLPDLIHVDNYLDRIFLGEMGFVLQSLRAAAAHEE